MSETPIPPYVLHTRLTAKEDVEARALVDYPPPFYLFPHRTVLVHMTDALRAALRAYDALVANGRIDCVLATVRSSLGAVRNLRHEEKLAYDAERARQAALPVCEFPSCAALPEKLIARPAGT